MADIIFPGSDYAGSNALYFIAYRLSDSLYVNGIELDAYDATQWTSYAVALTKNLITGDYEGTFPQVVNGDYFVDIYQQLGAQPATGDNLLSSGDFAWDGYGALANAPDTFAAQVALDAATFVNENEFAEEITYKATGENPQPMWAIVIRKLPDSTSDGHRYTDVLHVLIKNDAANGRTTITPERDVINVAARFGGPAADHLVAAVLNADAGAWYLELR